MKFFKKDKNKLFNKINKVIHSKDETVEKYSLIRELKDRELINNNFLYVLDSLSLENIISIKLELSFKSLKYKLINLDFLNNLDEFIEKTILQYAMSICDSYREIAYITGINSLAKLNGKLLKYSIKREEKEEQYE